MKIRNYMKPSSKEEAYELIQSGGTVIGGGAWLKLLPKTIETAIDISGLGLEAIRETKENIYIGSMVSLRSLETSSLIQGYMGGLLSDAASHIMGVTVRNLATVGGSVANRFGFSDLITPLLALDAVLNFHHSGPMPLQDFLSKGLDDKDLLVEVVLKKDQGKGVYKTLKKTSTDFPVLNVSVVHRGSLYRIAVGARPGVATCAEKAEIYMDSQSEIHETVLEEAALIASKALTFGSNSRGSAAYRQQVAATLVRRCLEEVAL